MTTVNIAPLQQRLAKAEKAVARISRNAVNDAAFAARTRTPGYLREAIDRPAPFTTSPSASRVTRASYADLTATLFISPKQAAYLDHIENGTPSERLIQPIAKTAFSSYGGIVGRFRRTAANVARLEADTRQKNGFFIGRPRGGKKDFAGIFQRKGDRITTIARFIKRRANRKTIDIVGFWSGILPDLIAENVAKQRARPENEL